MGIQWILLLAEENDNFLALDSPPDGGE